MPIGRGQMGVVNAIHLEMATAELESILVDPTNASNGSTK